MKTFNIKEIARLHEDWWDECAEYWFEEGYRFKKTFKEWLEDKFPEL